VANEAAGSRGQARKGQRQAALQGEASRERQWQEKRLGQWRQRRARGSGTSGRCTPATCSSGRPNARPVEKNLQRQPLLTGRHPRAGVAGQASFCTAPAGRDAARISGRDVPRPACRPLPPPSPFPPPHLCRHAVAKPGPSCHHKLHTDTRRTPMRCSRAALSPALYGRVSRRVDTVVTSHAPLTQATTCCAVRYGPAVWVANLERRPSARHSPTPPSAPTPTTDACLPEPNDRQRVKVPPPVCDERPPIVANSPTAACARATAPGTLSWRRAAAHGHCVRHLAVHSASAHTRLPHAWSLPRLARSLGVYRVGPSPAGAAGSGNGAAPSLEGRWRVTGPPGVPPAAADRRPRE